MIHLEDTTQPLTRKALCMMSTDPQNLTFLPSTGMVTRSKRKGNTRDELSYRQSWKKRGNMRQMNKLGRRKRSRSTRKLKKPILKLNTRSKLKRKLKKLRDMLSLQLRKPKKLKNRQSVLPKLLRLQRSAN